MLALPHQALRSSEAAAVRSLESSLLFPSRQGVWKAMNEGRWRKSRGSELGLKGTS